MSSRSITSSVSFLTEVQGLQKDIDLERIHANIETPSGFTMDIMMRLHTQNVSDLKTEFDQHEDGRLSLLDFVAVMQRFLKTYEETSSSSSSLSSFSSSSSSSLNTISGLCDFFAQIDVNGDGHLEWEEFTSFIVETGLAAVRDDFHDTIMPYDQVQWDEDETLSTLIDKILYFPENDRLVMMEAGAKAVKIYTSNLTCIKVLRRPLCIILAVTYIGKYGGLYVISSSDLQINLYEENTFRSLRSFNVLSSQSILAWYPEADTMLSSGNSGVIYVWDMNIMEERYHIGRGSMHEAPLRRGHMDAVLDLLPMPSLDLFASASMDTCIKLWDTRSGKCKQTLLGHSKGVRSLAFSKEYRFLISVGFDYDVIVWNPYVKDLITKLTGHIACLARVQIVPHTPQVITADVDGTFKVWDIRSFHCVQTFTSDRSLKKTRDFVVLLSQKRLVAAGKVLTQFEYQRLEYPELTDEHPIFAARYNSETMTFITGAGKDIKIWDGKNGSLLRQYRNLSPCDLTAMVLDSRERKIVLGDHDGNIKVYDYSTGALMKRFEYAEMGKKAHKREVSKLIYCDKHRLVISASWDATICVSDESDPDRGVLLRQMTGGHKADITALAYSETLSLIASGASDGSLQLWDFEHGKLEGTCIGHTSSITAVVFLEPYPLLIATDTRGNIVVWTVRPSLNKHSCVFRFRNEENRKKTLQFRTPLVPVTVLAIDTDKRSSLNCCTLYTGDENGKIRVWDLLPLLKQLKSCGIIPVPQPNLFVNANRILKFQVTDEIPREVQSARQLFEKRDKHLTFFFLPGTPILSDIENFECTRSWTAHTDQILSLHLIAEPPSLLTSSFDRMANVWDREGSLLGSLRQGSHEEEEEEEVVKNSWKFQVNVEKQQEDKREKATSVQEALESKSFLLHSKLLSKKGKKEERLRYGIKKNKKEDMNVMDALRLEELQAKKIENNFFISREMIPLLDLKPLLLGTGKRRTPRKIPITARTAGKSKELRLPNTSRK